MKTRRLRRFLFDPMILPGLFRKGTFVEVKEGIPPDAVYRGFAIDPARNMLVIFIEHPSWEEVPEHLEVPVGEPAVITTFDDPSIQAFKRFIGNFKEQNG